MTLQRELSSRVEDCALRIVVVAINLSYNGLPEETEEEPNEEVPGGFIILNDNDNAGGEGAGETNGVPDNEEASFTHADDDLPPAGLNYEDMRP